MGDTTQTSSSASAGGGRHLLATIYPGNGVVAYENSATDFRARVYREGAGTNRAGTSNFYFGDTICDEPSDPRPRLRYDRSGGEALPSTTASTPPSRPRSRHQLHRL